jgi:molybdate transport system substrate-binding protein
MARYLKRGMDASAIKAAVVASLLLLNLGAARAADIKLLCAEGMKPAMEELIANFERISSHRVSVRYATGGVVANWIRGGEPADLTILPRPAFDSLIADSKVAASTRIAQSLLAIAVRTGTPKPDISSSEALKRTLLAAKAIGYSDPARGGGIGRQAAQVIERLGIANELKAKTILTPAGEFRELLATGQVELAFVFPIVVVNDRRIEVVGPIPAELQNMADTTFLAGVTTGASEPAAAKALMQYLLSPAAAEVIKNKGMDPG